MQAMRRLFSYQVAAFLLLAGMTAGAQAANLIQNGAPSDNPPAASATSARSRGTPAVPETLTPGVTITGKPLYGERPLPKLAPDEFMSCYRMNASFPDTQSGIMALVIPMSMCEHQRQREEHTVIAACLYPDHGETPPRMVQACTETLAHDLLASDERYFAFAARAGAYLANGDPRHALADYDEAIKLDPHEAELYYNRGVVFAAQSDGHAALRDLDTAIGLEPKNARFWGERGSLLILHRDYQGAINDETQAIQLEPKLAPAYFLRADAFANVGNQANAVSDLHTAVDLDPSLARYVTIQGKTVSLQLPPL